MYKVAQRQTYVSILFIIYDISMAGGICIEPSKILLPAANLSTLDLNTTADRNTCYRLNILNDLVHGFLHNCRFVLERNFNSRQKCEKVCQYHAPCDAYAFSEEMGCGLCCSDYFVGNNISYPLDDVFLTAAILETFIDGE